MTGMASSDSPSDRASSTPWENLTTVPIRDIVLRPDFQVRFKADQGVIKGYATIYKRNAHKMPPLKVARIGKALVLVDGWHRLAALEKLGESLAYVEIVPCEDERDALWLAASSNLSHGLRLKNKEKVQVFRAYIKAGKHKKNRDDLKSYRDMEADMNGAISYGSIRNWMKRYYPSIFRKMSGQDDPPSGDGCPAKRIRTMKDETKEYLDMALAAFRGVESPEDRQELFKMAERVVQAMGQDEPGETWEDVHGTDLGDF